MGSFRGNFDLIFFSRGARKMVGLVYTSLMVGKGLGRSFFFRFGDDGRVIPALALAWHGPPPAPCIQSDPMQAGRQAGTRAY